MWQWFECVIFKQFVVSDIQNSFGEIDLSWMPMGFIDDKSTLLQVRDWCCQATSHYLSQCRPSSVLAYGVTGPWWVHIFLWPEQNGHFYRHFFFQRNVFYFGWNFTEVCSQGSLIKLHTINFIYQQAILFKSIWFSIHNAIFYVEFWA